MGLSFGLVLLDPILHSIQKLLGSVRFGLAVDEFTDARTFLLGYGGMLYVINDGQDRTGLRGWRKVLHILRKAVGGHAEAEGAVYEGPLLGHFEADVVQGEGVTIARQVLLPAVVGPHGFGDHGP